MPNPVDVIVAGIPITHPIAASVKIWRATGDLGVARGRARPATIVIERDAKEGLLGPFKVATNRTGLHKFISVEFSIPNAEDVIAYTVSAEKAVVSDWRLTKSRDDAKAVIETIVLTAGKVSLWADGHEAYFELPNYEI